jgi:sugar phosphate isomerase/epimerase
MKYAFMSFSCPDLGLREMLALARRLGYDGIEPRIAEGHRHGVEIAAVPAQRAEFKHMAAESRVAVCCVATSCQYSNPAETDHQVAETRQAIDLAADVGAPVIRVFGGILVRGLKRYEAIRLVAKSLLSVADHARARGVVVCLETHDDWSDPAYVAELMRRIDHPAIAVNWDFMHPGRAPGATVDESFALVKPWIRHVHFHDGFCPEGKIDLRPVGTGDVDVKRAVELLETAGYAGYLSGEWINWEPAEVHLPRELAAIKSYERTR